MNTKVKRVFISFFIVIRYSTITGQYPREHESTPRFLIRYMLFICLVLVLSYNVSLRSEFHVAMSVTTSAYNRCLSLPPDVCRRAHVLITLFVFVCASGVQHILWCCIFVLLLHLVYPMSLTFIY